MSVHARLTLHIYIYIYIYIYVPIDHLSNYLCARSLPITALAGSLSHWTVCRSLPFLLLREPICKQGNAGLTVQQWAREMGRGQTTSSIKSLAA